MNGGIGTLPYCKDIIDFRLKNNNNNLFTQTANGIYWWPISNYAAVGAIGGLINLPVITYTGSAPRTTTLIVSNGYWIRKILFATNNGVPHTARQGNITLNLG